MLFWIIPLFTRVHEIKMCSFVLVNHGHIVLDCSHKLNQNEWINYYNVAKSCRTPVVVHKWMNDLSLLKRLFFLLCSYTKNTLHNSSMFGWQKLGSLADSYTFWYKYLKHLYHNSTQVKGCCSSQVLIGTGALVMIRSGCQFKTTL